MISVTFIIIIINTLFEIGKNLHSSVKGFTSERDRDHIWAFTGVSLLHNLMDISTAPRLFFEKLNREI